MVEALLSRRITDSQSLWEAADLLRLPTTGPYVVVAAELPAIGKLGLPAIENKLAARDIRSAWRLLPDLHVGIVHVRIRDTISTLTSVLHQVATVRVGISPPFDDLAETSDALRFARLAVTGKPSADSLITAFQDTPLAVAAVSAPEVMGKIRSTVLHRLIALPTAERTILLDTFQAWLQEGGSANDTATKIFCHPNTVRHRLRRIEELTDRSLSRPLTSPNSAWPSKSSSGCPERPGHAFSRMALATTYRTALATTLWTWSPALRIPNACTISNAPITTSQLPTTTVNNASESNGQDRTTMPAIKLITPKKITHPRPGRPGSLIADAAVDAPRKMNPTAIQMASNRYAYP